MSSSMLLLNFHYDAQPALREFEGFIIRNPILRISGRSEIFISILNP